MASKLLLISLMVTPLLAAANTPDDYFHAGVQDYIFGQKEQAKIEIGTGLQLYPTDPKLNGAWQLLQKKEQDQQQQKQNQQQQQDKDQKDKQDQQNQNQQQQQKQNQQQDQKSEQQKKDEEKAKQDQAKKDQQKRQQQQQQANQGQKDDQKPEEGQQASATELHMSPQEARKLLDSLKDDSKILLFSPTNQPVNAQPGKFKDW